MHVEDVDLLSNCERRPLLAWRCNVAIDKSPLKAGAWFTRKSIKPMSAWLNQEERLGTGEVAQRLMQIFSQQETSKYCSNCEQQVLAVRPGTSRLKNLVLTLLTCGIWIVFWLLDARRRPGWRCRQCDTQLK